MSNELQFTFSGKLHNTLDAVPYNGFLTSKEVAEKLKIHPSLASARLKLLYDNGAVFRKNTGRGYFLWTRSKTLPLDGPAPVVKEHDPSAREKIAAYLKTQIGETITYKDIMDATGVPLADLQSAMNDLYRLAYVEREKENGEWVFMPNERITQYKSKTRTKRVTRQVAVAKAPEQAAGGLSIEDFTNAFNQMKQQRDDYRAALEAIQSILARTISNN